MVWFQIGKIFFDDCQFVCKTWAVSGVFFSHHLVNIKVAQKAAPDTGDSAAFSSIFLASSFLCSQAKSTHATRVRVGEA